MCSKSKEDGPGNVLNLCASSQIPQSVDLVVVGVDTHAEEHELAYIVVERILKEGENVPMRLERLKTPHWFDVHKFKRGQRYFFQNYYAMFVTKLSGLLLVLCIPSILRILVMTGKSSTPAKAFRRYMDTISDMLQWYNGDLSECDHGIYQVLSSVRGKHCAAAKKSVTAGKETISQKDIALTQFGFMGLAILQKEYFGIKGNHDDVEGFIHFWRTIGYFMGLEDRYNICNGSITHVTLICQQLSTEFFKPHLENPPENFTMMAEALLDGMKPVIPLFHKDGFLEFTRQRFGLTPKPLKSKHAKLILSLQIYVHSVLFAIWWLALIVRPILNALLRFSIFANCQKYPLLAMWMFGREVSHQQRHHETNIRTSMAPY